MGDGHRHRRSRVMAYVYPPKEKIFACALLMADDGTNLLYKVFLTFIISTHFHGIVFPQFSRMASFNQPHKCAMVGTGFGHNMNIFYDFFMAFYAIYLHT